MTPAKVPLRRESKFIVMSDCHRGDGSAGDEFASNSLIYKCALEYYLENGFTYIELGDAEELWENDDFEQIYITHTSVYDLLRRFHDPDPAKTRYLKVWGNHDEDWHDDPASLRSLFPGIQVHEAVILGPILLLHGHQADPTCSGPKARFTRFLVRKVWSGLQKFGIGDPTRAAENPGRCDAVDETLYNFAKEKDPDMNRKYRGGGLARLRKELGKSGKYGDMTVFQQEMRIVSPYFPEIVIAGHTHRPVFENLSLTERRCLESGIGTPGVCRKEKADPVYYNTGSCVHPRCITGIEITAEARPNAEAEVQPEMLPQSRPAGSPDEIRPRFTLVKWGLCADTACADDIAEAPSRGNGHVSRERDTRYPLAIARTPLETG